MLFPDLNLAEGRVCPTGSKPKAGTSSSEDLWVLPNKENIFYIFQHTRQGKDAGDSIFDARCWIVDVGYLICVYIEFVYTFATKLYILRADREFAYFSAPSYYKQNKPNLTLMA
jgi:hypothetical protein